jgi:hypothetical protein
MPPLSVLGEMTLPLVSFKTSNKSYETNIITNNFNLNKMEAPPHNNFNRLKTTNLNNHVLK